MPGRRAERREKLQFSKILAIVVTILFAAVLVFAACMWVIRGETPSEIMSYVGQAFMVVLTVYLAKSGVENYAKIKSSDDEQ